jgi:hypothetical protein
MGNELHTRWQKFSSDSSSMKVAALVRKVQLSGPPLGKLLRASLHSLHVPLTSKHYSVQTERAVPEYQVPPSSERLLLL